VKHPTDHAVELRLTDGRGRPVPTWVFLVTLTG